MGQLPHYPIPPEAAGSLTPALLGLVVPVFALLVTLLWIAIV